MRPVRMVIKLGGSLYDSPLLPAWAGILGGLARHEVVVVPGGGPFADLVGAAQSRWALPDPVAHRMAILAMEQFGLVLCGLCPELAVADDVARMSSALKAGLVPVWMPSRALAAAPDLPQDWDCTSDSLALWLAQGVGAERLVLVKSCPVPATTDPRELCTLGIVDRAFPRLHARRPLPLDLVSAEAPEAFRSFLDQRGLTSAA